MKRSHCFLLLPLLGATFLTHWTVIVGGSKLNNWIIDHGDHTHTDVHKDLDFAKQSCREGAVCIPVTYSSVSCSAWSNIQSTREVRAMFKELQCGYLHDEPMVCVPYEHVSRDQQCKIDDDKTKTPNYNLTIDEAISALAGALSEKGTPWDTASPPKCGTVITDVRISDGQDAYPGEFPWMAALMYKRLNNPSLKLKNLCGGSLVSRRVVLTAAHCVARSDEYKLEAVRLGDNDLSTMFDCKNPDTTCVCPQGCDYRTGVKCLLADSCAPPHHVYKVANMVAHPEFRKEGKLLVNDVALVFLAKDVMLTLHIQPVCLPYPQFKEDEVKLKIVTGWGNTNGQVGDYIPAEILQKLIVELVPMEECGKIWFEDTSQVSEEMICARPVHSTVGKGACTGDSGGPLVYTKTGLKYVQYGVVSFGSPACGDPKPTFYALLNQGIVAWITQQIGAENLPQTP